MMVNDYKCKECGHEQEIWVRTGEEPKCKKCGGEVKKIWKSSAAVATADGFKV